MLLKNGEIFELSDRRGHFIHQFSLDELSFSEPEEGQLDPVAKEIGRSRYDIWKATGHINESAFPDGIWWDELDGGARHWAAADDP